jgi:hypothetical protein
MSITDVNVVVPMSGDGPIVSVSGLTGEKTVQLTGQFVGRYVLLGSQNDANFTPIVNFDSDGKEGIKITLPISLSSVRVRSQASNPVDVTMRISGVAGSNLFGTVATIPVGGTGQQPIVALSAILPPSGVEQDICFLCTGSFEGLLIVEGSMDGIRFNPIGAGFRDEGELPSLLGTNAPLEFSPLVASELVRYVRITLNGVASSDVVVTVGGSNPTVGSLGVPMSVVVSNAGGSTLQALGQFVIPSLGSYTTLLGEGNTLNPLLASTVVVGSENNAGGTSSDFSVVVGNRHTLASNNAASTLVGHGNGLDNNCDHSVLMGSQLSAGSPFAIVIGVFDSGAIPLYRVGTSSQDSVVIGHNSTIGDVCAGTVVIGLESSANNGSSNAVVVGGSLSDTLSVNSVLVGFNGVMDSSDWSTLLGNGSRILNSSNSIAIGAGNTIALTGTVGDTNFAIGLNNQLIDHFHAMSRNGVFGISNSLGGATDVGTPTECMVIGLYNTVKAAYRSLIFGENCELDNTGGTVPSYVVLLGNHLNVKGDQTITIGFTSENDGVGGIILGNYSSIPGNCGNTIAIGNNCVVGANSYESLCMHGASIGTYNGVGAAFNIAIGRTSSIADGTSCSIILGGFNGGGNSIATQCVGVYLIGGRGSVGTLTNDSVAIGTYVGIGTASSSTVAIGDGPRVGDNCDHGICIGNSSIGTVGGTGPTSDNITIGHANSIPDGVVRGIVIGVRSSVDVGSFDCIAMGREVLVQSQNSIAIGTSTSIGKTCDQSIVLGGTVSDGNRRSINLGGRIEARAQSVNNHGPIAIGFGSRIAMINAGTDVNASIVIGAFATVNDNAAGDPTDSMNVAIGYGSQVGGGRCVGLGPQCNVGDANESIAIGYQAQANGGDHGHIVIGGRAKTGNTSVASAGAVVIGYQASALDSDYHHIVVVGAGATSSTLETIVVGASASGNSSGAVAIGVGASVLATHTNSQAYGRNAVTTQAQEVVFGATTAPLKLFHAFYDRAATPINPELFAFRGDSVVNNGDTDMYLFYKNNAGTFLTAQVKIDASGYLKLPL